MGTYKDMAEEFCELEGLGHSSGDAWKMMELSRLLSGIFLLPVATQSHQIKISMNRKQI